jgi:lipopolysaccharide/colanic/teichoic acid biosynthesis glycosyltransferase
MASVGLLFASPVIAVAAILIRVETVGPVIFHRRVVGQYGLEFDAFKLRTMRVDADEWLERRPDLVPEYGRFAKLRVDPRVTRVGAVLRRFSLDELPQLVNVLKGQMSMVGPRMIHPSELERFGEFGAVRLAVKPGLTGPWQISKNISYDYRDRITLDRWYLRRRTIRLDLWLLARTLPAIVGRRVDFGPILKTSDE